MSARSSWLLAFVRTHMYVTYWSQVTWACTVATSSFIYNGVYVRTRAGATPARSRFFFLQTRIAISQYFSQSYGAYFKYIVRTCTCAYTYCKCLRDVNDILRHIKIRAIWLAEMQSSFAENKIAGPVAYFFSPGQMGPISTVAHIRQFLENPCFFTVIYRRTIALYRRTLLRYIAVLYCVISPYYCVISPYFIALYRRTIALYRRTIALYRRTLLRYIAVLYCVISPYYCVISP